MRPRARDGSALVRFSGLALTILLVAPCQSSVHAHVGDRVYPVLPLSELSEGRVNVRDGSATEWPELFGVPSLTAADFPSSDEFDQFDPASFDFRLWLAWSERTNRIYVAMEQADDIYFNELDRSGDDASRGFMLDHDGSIQISVDGDHSGGPYLAPRSVFDSRDEYLLFNMQEAQFYMAIAEAFDNRPHLSTLLHVLEAGYPEWMVEPPFGDSGGSRSGESPVLTVTELYLTPFDRLVWDRPSDSEVSDLSADRVIGLSISVSDHDFRGEGEESFHSLTSGLSGNGVGADLFVDGQLLRLRAPDPDSVIGRNSWGRIKAAFALE